MAKQTYTIGQVLTAAQMTTLQANDYNQTVSAKVASYTLVASDAGTRITMSNASATTITVNTSLFTAGDTLIITNIGAGVCTVTAGTATVSTAGSLALNQYDSGTLYFTSTGVSIWNGANPGDITGVTAGTGISGGGTSGSVTVTNSMATAITTNGDVIYGTGSGTFTRLGIGSSAQVLTVASGVPSWATPASGGGMTLISTTTMNAGNFTLSSIAGTYKHLKLVLVDVYLNTAAEYMWIRCNGDTGSNYQRRQYTNNAGTLSGGTTIQTNHLIGQAGASNTDITNGFANIDLYNYTATSGGQLIVSQQSGYDSANLWGMLNTGVYNKSAAITSITVGANNSFAGGTCLFYGVS